MKILLVGNCQTLQLETLLSLTPKVQITRIPFGKLAEANLSKEHIAEFDVVVAQDAYSSEFPNLWDAVRIHPRAITIPSFVFRGFHPDLINIRLPDGIGRAHSRIAVCAYLEGLSSNTAISLFNHEFYTAAGYYSAFSSEKASLLKVLSKYVSSPEVLFQRWNGNPPIFNGVQP